MTFFWQSGALKANWKLTRRCRNGCRTWSDGKRGSKVDGPYSPPSLHGCFAVWPGGERCCNLSLTSIWTREDVPPVRPHRRCYEKLRLHFRPRSRIRVLSICAPTHKSDPVLSRK